MKHGGTNYVGITDQNAAEWAPADAYIWKMNMATGEHQPLISVADMASRMYPSGHEPAPDATLYFFSEVFDPSGNRFTFFVKDARPVVRAGTEGYSANLDGGDIPYLHRQPNHHYWIDDKTVMDNGWHIPPGGKEQIRGYFVSKDDDSGKP